MPTSLANLVQNIDPPVEISQAEYDNLTTEQKNDGTVYYIVDGSEAHQTAATTPAKDRDNLDSNVQVELNKKLEQSNIVNSLGALSSSGYVLDARQGNVLDQQSKVLVKTATGISSIPSAGYSFSDATGVTADMVVVNSVLSNPAAQTSAWTVTTGTNSIVVKGSIASGQQTDLTLYLQTQR